LDVFEVAGDARRAIESQHRPESVTIRHTKYGHAVIRDQKPMTDSALRKCLNGLTPEQWYETLNRKVFFWLDHKRLLRLLKARAYRNKCHCVITFDTARLIQIYSAKVRLSPINSGCTLFNAQQRGAETFRLIRDYPFDQWKAKRASRDAVVELTVDYSVENVRQFADHVCHMQGEQVLENIL
jgi:hypothetical protein